MPLDHTCYLLPSQEFYDSAIGFAQRVYGYINEYYGDSTQLTYLRSRYYSSGMGRFLTRDTWGGDYNSPLSLNRWNYTNANPINFLDPSGKAPSDSGNYPRRCQSMPTKAEYAACVLRFFELEPLDPNDMSKFVTGGQGCYTGPTEYRAPGHIEGLNYSINAGDSSFSKTWGFEVVYDFATLQRQSFDYQSLWPGGDADFVSFGISDSQYFGVVKGFKTSVDRRYGQRYDINSDYQGTFESYAAGASVGEIGSINTGFSYFQSPEDPLIRGAVWYFGGGAGLGSPVSYEYSLNNYTSSWHASRNYVLGNGSIDLGGLRNDIINGDGSPLLWFELSASRRVPFLSHLQ